MEVHPIQLKLNRFLTALFPKIRLYQSPITGKLLISGSLGNHTLQLRGVSEIVGSLSIGTVNPRNSSLGELVELENLYENTMNESNNEPTKRTILDSNNKKDINAT